MARFEIAVMRLYIIRIVYYLSSVYSALLPIHPQIIVFPFHVNYTIVPLQTIILVTISTDDMVSQGYK
ncbi:hypothetical protein CLU79DRAFT_758281 [Phycomyces nitens]|nr:hypothetical protein CLU79DRAFT_758281 [Phycomyces nitens]